VIFALHQSAWETAGGDVPDTYIVRHVPEQTYPFANEHGNLGNDQAVHKTSPEKSLHGVTTVEVNVANAAG
jgi:hypothetical protein